MQTKLVQLSAKPNSLSVDEIKALQNGDNHARRESREDLSSHDRAEEVGREAQTIKFDFGEVGADCLMLNRIVADGMAVEANQHFTVALDLKITDDLRRACVARELVNRIQIPQRRAQRPSLLGHYRAAGNPMRSMKTAVRTRTTPSPTRLK